MIHGGKPTAHRAFTSLNLIWSDSQPEGFRRFYRKVLSVGRAKLVGSGKNVARFLYIVITTLALSHVATPAWAVQAHGGEEGLVAHQIGHILFTGGMVYLLYHLNNIAHHEPGWLQFKIFLYLIIAWNVLTFTGHWMHENIDPTKFSTVNSETASFTISNFHDALYYATRLDHLLLLPAIVFLLLALRKWNAQR